MVHGTLINAWPIPQKCCLSGYGLGVGFVDGRTQKIQKSFRPPHIQLCCQRIRRKGVSTIQGVFVQWRGRGGVAFILVVAVTWLLCLVQCHIPLVSTPSTAAIYHKLLMRLVIS